MTVDQPLLLHVHVFQDPAVAEIMQLSTEDIISRTRLLENECKVCIGGGAGEAGERGKGKRRE